MTARRVLAFEPFDGGSHRQVRRTIERRSRHRWQWWTRPARAWKWRMRLAAFELVAAARADGAFDGERPDAIVATSLLNAAELRAALPRGWRDLPLVVYVHENQAAYPAGASGPDPRDAHFPLTNLASMLAADRVLFSSRWNLESFLEGIAALLRHAPDARLGDALEAIRARSVVAWPPVEPPPTDLRPGRISQNAVRVVWPHRWEHDKGPDLLLETARSGTNRDDLRWVILGERFRRTPTAIDAFIAEFADRIDHVGHLPDRAAYWAMLASCDWVLSTARHEFFGIAVVEALLAGCLPWLPERLSYPELLPAVARGLSPTDPPDDPEAVRAAIRSHLTPALAENAVARIDDLIESVVRGG